MKFHDENERYPVSPADNWQGEIINALGKADATHKEKLMLLLSFANSEHRYARKDGELKIDASMPEVALAVQKSIDKKANDILGWTPDKDDW